MKDDKYIQCPRCGNPRCSLQHDDTFGWWVWCIAPECNRNGPRAWTPEAAIDAFMDKMAAELVKVEKCPKCGGELNLYVGWSNGHSDYIVTHKERTGACDYDREIHFTSEESIKRWLGSSSPESGVAP